jgi:hypothetical protein
LIALLLPAVQSAREAARRSTCLNNMKQVALGLHTHHDTKGYFPHGNYNDIDGTGNTPAPYNGMQDRRCWMHDILAYLEQTSIAEEFEDHMTVNASALSFPNLHNIIPSAMCPSDPTNPKLLTFWGGMASKSAPAPPTQGFSGNMVACAGNDFHNAGGAANSAKLNGVFYARSKTRVSDIIDGSTNTVLLSEIILSPDKTGHDIRGRYHNPAHGGVLFSTRITPNTLVPDQLNWCAGPPLARAPCNQQGNDIFLSARSYHSGGVNLAMSDASVRFVNNRISANLFKNLGSRNGSETVGNF